MPPRKEPKETVVYPASKRKPPPFKPLRPSKAPRVSTTEPESSRSQPVKRITAQAFRRTQQNRGKRNDDESEDGLQSSRLGPSRDETSDDELPTNPITSKPTNKPKRPPPPKRKPPRGPSPIFDSSQHFSAPSIDRPSSPPSRTAAPVPSQSDTVPTIPQPLLVRLLHEHFVNKVTKIDKHAIQVLQKYFEVFVREAIARAAARKKEDAAENGLSEVDVSWLELVDLEKVAAGMLLDF